MKTAPAPTLERSTATMAAAGFTLGLQPEIVPSSVANRNTAPPDLPPADTANSLPGLKTWPVGEPVAAAPAAAGMVTTSDWMAPVPS